MTVLLLALDTPFLADGIGPSERVISLGMLTGLVFVLVLGRVYAKKRDSGESATGSRTLSKNVTFSVLKNQRRREALRYLRRVGGTSGLSDVAEYVAAKENGVDRSELTSDQRKRVYITLYQSHLPMMDDVGIVEYDQDRGTVELLDTASELFEYLDDTTGTNGELTGTS